MLLNPQKQFSLNHPAGMAALFLVMSLLLSACSSTPKVHTQAKPNADYSMFQTFALLPLPAMAPANDPGLLLRVAEPARQTLTECLVARGFKPAELATADLAVNLRGTSLPKVEVTDYGYTRTVYSRRYGLAPVHFGQVDVRTYDERTLVVEIFDNRSKEQVWVGWIKKEARGQIKTEQVQEAIRTILSEFPPSVSKAPIAK